MNYIESKLQYLKKYSIEIHRTEASFFVLWIFIIEYGLTDHLSPEKIIVATAIRFGTDQYYSMYINPLVLYSLPIMGCIYVVLEKFERYIILEGKWKRVAGFIAIMMAFCRTLSESFYNVVSSDLFVGGGIITVFLLIGYYIVFFRLVCALFSCFMVKSGNVFSKYSQLNSLRKLFGKNKGFFYLWILYLICWMPRLILSYPMAFDWDTGLMFDTALNGVDHGYPAVQVMILKLLYQLGNAAGSVTNVFFAYMGIRYLYFTFLFAAIMFFFQSKISSRRIWFIVLGLTLFCPIFQSWSIYITKDTNYIFCYTGLTFLVCVFILDKELVLKHKFLCGISAIIFFGGIYFFRGNGVYIDVVFLVSALVSYVNIEKIKHKLACINFRYLMAIILIILFGVVGGILFCTRQGQGIDNTGKTAIEDSNSINGANLLKQHTSKYVKYYVYRMTSFFRNEVISRYSVKVRDNCPDEVAEILGNDLETICQIEYMAQYGLMPDNLLFDTDKQEMLMRYILINEPALFVESIIAKIHGFFDIFRHYSSTYGSGIEYGTYNMYELNKFWKNKVEWQIRGDLLRASYDRFRLIPILRITCETGLYVWLLIIVSIYLLIVRGRKVFCVLSPCWLSLLGAMLSGYNAYMRLCLPFVFSMPVLLLLCTVKDKDK